MANIIYKSINFINVNDYDDYYFDDKCAPDVFYYLKEYS
jgi:hypothetical protein